MSIKKIPAKPERAPIPRSSSAPQGSRSTLSGHAPLRSSTSSAPSSSSSARPLPSKSALPPARPRAQPPFQAKDNEQDELELVFDELAEEAEVIIQSGEGENESDAQAVRATFRDISGERMSAVHVLMSEGATDVPAEWIETCLPVVRSVTKAAADVEEPKVLAALERFTEALERAAKAGKISDADRQVLLDAYAPIAKAFPNPMGDADHAREQREPLVVLSLLDQVDGLSFAGQSRLFEAGLNRLAALGSVKPDELAAVSGISAEIASEIAAVFQRYVQQHGPTTSSIKPDLERRELAKLVDDLARTQERFEQAASRWNKAALEEKRRRRRERDVKYARVTVALARLGELSMLDELDRISYERRLNYLRSFASGASGDARTPA